MKEADTYRLELCPDFSRDLPIIKLRGSEHKIASFVMLGDVELNKKCAAILVDKMKEKNLLEKFGDISSIINADEENLKDVLGLGQAAIVQIKIIAEIINRVFCRWFASTFWPIVTFIVSSILHAV